MHSCTERIKAISGRKQLRFAHRFALAPKSRVSAQKPGSFWLALRASICLATNHTFQRSMCSIGNCFSSTAYKHSCLGEPRLEQRICTPRRIERISVSRRFVRLRLPCGIFFDRYKRFLFVSPPQDCASDAFVALHRRTVLIC